jgi:hypothetical protein
MAASNHLLILKKCGVSTLSTDSKQMKTIFTISIFFVTTNILFAQDLPLPYYTGFDNVAEQAGWQQYRTGFMSLQSWHYSNTGFSTPNCIFHDYNVGGNLTDTVIDWFISPALNFTSTGVVSLKVKTFGFSPPTVDNCGVWFGTNSQNPATGNFVLIGNISYMQPQSQWLDTSFAIPSASDSGFIAIRYKTIYAYWMTYSIDNITVSTTVGINEKEISNKIGITVYPNPLTSSATVQFSSEIHNGKLNLYNIYGEKMKAINNVTGKQIKIYKENLAIGVYFVQLTQENKVTGTTKLIITD